jgi:hypothetical protein
MKHIITHFLLFAAILSCSLLFHSCTKTPDEPDPDTTPKPCTNCLPPITTEGKNTFGCKVNGKIWLPKGGKGIPGTRLSYFDSNLAIIADNYSTDRYLNINIEPIYDTGYYDFTITNLSSSRGVYQNGDFTLFFISKPITTGYLHLTRFEPTSTGIVSGTFAFDAYNDKGDTVNITEGRFDLHF